MCRFFQGSTQLFCSLHDAICYISSSVCLQRDDFDMLAWGCWSLVDICDIVEADFQALCKTVCLGFLWYSWGRARRPTMRCGLSVHRYSLRSLWKMQLLLKHVSISGANWQSFKNHSSAIFSMLMTMLKTLRVLC